MRHALLALLAAGAAYGYELKQALDRLFGAVWPPINIGQIYTTIQRLERDGLVMVSETVVQARRPDRRMYELTDAGREALATWFATPADRPRLRDDFFVRLVLAQSSGVADAAALIRRQRLAYFQALSDLDALSAREQEAASQADGRLRHLLIEGAALHLQADLRWLALCEQALLEEAD